VSQINEDDVARERIINEVKGTAISGGAGPNGGGEGNLAEDQRATESPVA
jgi:hypothetical protein